MTKKILKLKSKIEKLFASHPKKIWWFSTLAEETRASLDDVVEVCRLLTEEGKVRVVESRGIKEKKRNMRTWSVNESK